MIQALGLDSSAIEAAVWDEGELRITFQDGRQHSYFGVPQRVFDALAPADDFHQPALLLRRNHPILPHQIQHAHATLAYGRC